ncbi:Molybdopterin molybdenumtransferase [bacterium HR19]|nr:Molybdopterin molybdenumtransferase [bacterium HR19]
MHSREPKEKKFEAYYITFEEARELLRKNVPLLEKITIDVSESAGYVLGEDIKAPISIPPFPNSSMDGYAIKGIDREVFRIVGEVKPGYFPKLKLRDGEAVKVFTGSPIPQNADAVVMIENTAEENGYIKVLRKPQNRENIREKGEEIKKGEIVLRKNSIITPPIAGLISELGLAKVKVFRKPKVFALVSGDEVIKPGKKLKPGKIYDANFAILENSLRELGIEEFRIKMVKDNPEEIEKQIREGVRWADIIITSGGISVGDRDFIRDVVMGIATPIFYKVKQKPGKPLFFGKIGKKLIFCLPGNPASAYILFFEYVAPAIRMMMGTRNPFPPEAEKILAESIQRKKAERMLFMRGKISGDYVVPLEKQESYMLSSFAEADCLIIVPEGANSIEKGEKVKVHLLHHC